MKCLVPGTAGIEVLEELGKMSVGEFGSLADLLLLLLLLGFIRYTLDLRSSSPLRSVHHRLQTNLLQLLLHIKKVAGNVYVTEQRFKLVINLNLPFEVVWVRNVLL